jgi:hypothetical protein
LKGQQAPYAKICKRSFFTKSVLFTRITADGGFEMLAMTKSDDILTSGIFSRLALRLWRRRFGKRVISQNEAAAGPQRAIASVDAKRNICETANRKRSFGRPALI